MPDDTHETLELARRFLLVLETLFKLTRHKMPNHIQERLPPNQVKGLHIIYHDPGISQKKLAEILGITPAAISAAVRELETLALVERKADTEDARLMRLYLSDSGQAIIQEMQAIRCGAIADLLNALSLAEQCQVVETLERAVKVKQEELNIQP
ncbi:MAG TPA: MarR family transcriptional regulator [Phototrophicaceae bacterium]|nr:MarR family transcriptional regulator [Phototrophicaceae bacterium]